MNIEESLNTLGIHLPEASSAGAIFVPVKQAGNILFVSGQLPMRDGAFPFIGKVGNECSLEDAQEAARLCIVNMLTALKGYLQDLNRIADIVKIQVFVNSGTGFDRQHLVANAASQLLVDIFGESGKHARTAVGVAQLPFNVPVEAEAIIILKQ